MSKSLNISVLVAARDEYIEQLKCILIPLLTQGFNSIYQDALKISENKKTIYKFQELLKQIPQWNQTILQEESKRIKKKCPYIMDIVTAIFVTNVKILASVRLKGSREDIRVKIPTSDIFIHSIYIEAAQQIFYDPFLFYHKTKTIQDNKQHTKQIISYSIDETIRQMLPFDDILQKYLADALKDNAEFGESDSESEKSVSDSDEESLNDEDFPSDESEPESEPDPDKDHVKSFGINSNDKPNDYQFIKDPESDDGSDIDEDGLPDLPVFPPVAQSEPSSISEQPFQPVQQQQPFQPVQPVQQQPVQQQFVQQHAPQAPPPQQQGYSFF
jgi:hypothetical protein